MRLRRGGDDATRAVDKDSFRFIGTDIDAKMIDDEAKIPGKVTRSLSSSAPLLRTYFAGSGPSR